MIWLLLVIMCLTGCEYNHVECKDRWATGSEAVKHLKDCDK